MSPDELVNRMHGIKEKIPAYIPLAKVALWFVSTVLAAIVIAGSYDVGLRWWVGDLIDPCGTRVANVISACQVLVVVTLAILGYRGGGGRIKR